MHVPEPSMYGALAWAASRSAATCSSGTFSSILLQEGTRDARRCMPPLCSGLTSARTAEVAWRTATKTIRKCIRTNISKVI